MLISLTSILIWCGRLCQVLTLSRGLRDLSGWGRSYASADLFQGKWCRSYHYQRCDLLREVQRLSRRDNFDIAYSVSRRLSSTTSVVSKAALDESAIFQDTRYSGLWWVCYNKQGAHTQY